MHIQTHPLQTAPVNKMGLRQKSVERNRSTSARKETKVIHKSGQRQGVPFWSGMVLVHEQFKGGQIDKTAHFMHRFEDFELEEQHKRL